MTNQESAPKRMTTGVGGLDVVLNGGFVEGGVYIVIGPPGAGKTILANQISFNHAHTGGRVLYCTLLAESHSRMFQNLRGLEFFSAGTVSKSVVYVSGYKILEEQGLTGLLTLLRQEAARHQATLLILDGLVSAEAFAASTLAVKKFVHELQVITSLIGCTGFLLTSGSEENRIGSPEHTMVDGLIELTNEVVGVRQLRLLHVKKFRGSAHLGGTHSFQIDDRGVTVFPRIESIVTAHQRPPAADARRATTGIAGLDEMLEGGPSRSSITLVTGPTGSGKALVGLHFVADGIKNGENVVYFGFHESPDRLVEKAKGVGLDLAPAEADGRLRIVWHPSVDLLIDALAHEMLEVVRAHNATRLVVDSLRGFHDAVVVRERIPRFLAALANELRRRGVTTLFLDETPSLFPHGVEPPDTSVSSVVDNVVLLRQVEIGARLEHVAAVLKTRQSDHDRDIRLVTITGRGLAVHDPVEAGDGILLGSPSSIARTKTPRKNKKNGGRRAAGRRRR